MSANEVIDQIKQLSADERELVVAYVKSLVDGGALREDAGVRYMDAEKAKKVSAGIFSERAELFRKLAS